MPVRPAKQRSVARALTRASRSPPGPSEGGNTVPGYTSSPSQSTERAKRAPPRSFSERQKSRSDRRVEAPEPVEPDLEAVRSPSTHLVTGGDHPLHERPPRAAVGAVRRVRRDREVDLVGDLKRHHAPDPPEAPHHLPHVPPPGRDVALLAPVGVIAHLELDQVAAPGKAAGQPEVAAKARFAVGPEEAVEAQDEGPAGSPQAGERRVGSRGTLGHRPRRDGPHLAGLYERPDAKAQRRSLPGAEVLGPQVADAGARGGQRERESEHQERRQQEGAAHGGGP